MAAYMEYTALHELIREGPAVSGAYLAVEDGREAALNDQLKTTGGGRQRLLAGRSSGDLRPAAGGEPADLDHLPSRPRQHSDIGVVYNGARIALSERGRELASLRVLGFTRREVTVLLLGEQGAITLLAIPIGWLFGFGFVVLTLSSLDTERYRFPLMMAPRTYLVSAVVTLFAAALASVAVRRRLHRLDLIAVLKTRE